MLPYLMQTLYVEIPEDQRKLSNDIKRPRLIEKRHATKLESREDFFLLIPVCIDF